MNDKLLKSLKKYLNFNSIFASIFAFIISTIVIYLIYPYMDETLNYWNGEISGTVLDNVSFKKRLINFYILLIPAFSILFTIAYNIIIKIRITYFSNWISNICNRLSKINLSKYLFIINLSLLGGYIFLYSLPAVSNTHNWKEYFYSNILTNIEFFYKNVLFIIIIFILFYISNKLYDKYIKNLKNDDIQTLIFYISTLLFNITSYASKIFAFNQNINEKLSLINSDQYIFTILCLYFLIILSSIIFKNQSFFYNNFFKAIILYCGLFVFFKLLILNTYAVTILSSSFLIIFNYIFKKINDKEVLLLNNILFFVYIFPILYSFLYELLFTLRENFVFDIIVFNINLALVLVYIISILLLSIIFYKKNILIKDNLLIFISLLSILIFVFLNIKSHYVFNYDNYANIFELGNNTVVYESIKYGKLPFIDYFPAHALYDIWTQLLYYIVHKNVLGIFLSPYHGLIDIIGYIAFFYFVYLLFDDSKFALLFTLFMPLDVAGFKNITFNLISPMLVILLIKKCSIKNILLFWILTLLNAFYLYDGGITLGVASIFSFLIFCIYNNDKNALMKFITIGSTIGAVFLLFNIIYSFINDVNIIDRILEWKSLTLNSFASLAHTNIGMYFSLQYFVSYFVLPAFAVFSFFYSIKCLIFEKKQSVYLYLLIIFSMSQMLYISRGIAFHNYAITRGRTGVLFNYFSFTICIFAIILTNMKTQKKIYSIIYLILVSFVAIFLTLNPTSFVSSLIGKIINVSVFKEDIKHNDDYIQVTIDDETKKLYNSFKNLFDVLLEKDETFIDFANVTSVYAYANRKLPIYVAQSPGLLSDLQSQYYFLNEINNHKVPLVILGNSDTPYVSHIYDVQHNVRYYIIAEYIYNNYRPLASIDKTVIYCLNDKYNEYIEKLQNLHYNTIDYGYDYNKLVDDGVVYNYGHDYYIKNLAYVMGKYENFDNDEIVFSDSSKSFYNIDFQRKKNNSYYLIMEINNEFEKKDISVELFDNKNVIDGYRYNFTLREGKNKYAFRISQDYLLLCNNKINSIKINGINDVNNVKIKIVKRNVEK